MVPKAKKNLLVKAGFFVQFEAKIAHEPSVDPAATV